MEDLPASPALTPPAAAPLQESSPEQLRRWLRGCTSAGSKKVRAGVLVPLDDFLRRLGVERVCAWACYARYRDARGEAFPLRQTIIEDLSAQFGVVASDGQLDRYMRLLHAVGLVKDLCSEWRTGRNRVLYRRVLGQVVEERGEWYARVPEGVAAKLRARRGRGRPVGSGTGARPVRDGNCDAQESRTRTGREEIVTPVTISSSPSVPPGGSFSTKKNHDFQSSLSLEKVEASAAPCSIASTPPPEKRWPEKESDPSWLRRESGSSTSGSTASGADAPPAGGGSRGAATLPDDLGTTLELELERLTISLPADWYPTPGLDGVPDRPSRAILFEMSPHGYPVRTRHELAIPRVRPFTKSQLKDRAYVLNRMRNAFAGATHRKWLPRWTAKQRKAALDLARQLTNIGAAPETWLLRRSGSWKEISGDKSVLPLNAALSVKLFEDERRIAIFKSEESSFVTEHARPAKRTAAEQELWRRWEKMMAVLEFRAGDRLRPAPPTRQEIDSVVERFFPEDLWHRLVDRARREIDQEQRRIDKLAEEGRWLWS